MFRMYFNIENIDGTTITTCIQRRCLSRKKINLHVHFAKLVECRTLRDSWHPRSGFSVLHRNNRPSCRSSSIGNTKTFQNFPCLWYLSFRFLVNCTHNWIIKVASFVLSYLSINELRTWNFSSTNYTRDLCKQDLLVWKVKKKKKS